MARVLIHDQLPRALQGLEQPFRVLEGAQLVGFAGEAQVRYADFLGVPFPRERLAEFVEAVLVGEPRHVHEALLEGGEASSKIVWQPGSRHVPDTATAR